MSYLANILSQVESNHNFRKVLFTGKNSQLVIMNLEVGEDIGEEMHQHVEQTLFISAGTGKVVLDEQENALAAGDVVVVTPGTKHNIINTGNTPMKIFTIYAPANHIDLTVHPTKQDAQKDIEDELFGQEVQ